MKLSIGIVGLPNVGKSTLFKILTKQAVNIANYPFATIDPNVGVVSVPDERLTKLAVLSNSKKIIPAIVEFYDIAGLVKGANKGEGLGNQFLAHIRETQTIIIVLRVFPDAEIIHVENSVDPLRDLDIISTELILKDLETVEKRLVKAEGEARSGKKEAVEDRDFLLAIKKRLESGELLTGWPPYYSTTLKSNLKNELNLLTAKPQIYLLNGKESEVSEELKNEIKKIGADYVIADLAAAEEISALIKKCYEILNLMSFLTTGEDETRAWTVKKGTTAPQAAAAIHTDFEKKFIRAEIINWEKLIGAGGWSKAKSQGLIRTEGKDYIVQEGDVIFFKI